MSSFLKIGPTDELLEAWSGMQSSKKGNMSETAAAHKDDKWQIYTIDTKKNQIVLSKSGGAAPQEEKEDLTEDERVYKAFTANFKDDESCFGTMDYRKKLFFVMWNPDSAKPRLKMQYSSVHEPFKQALTGCNYFFQCTDAGSLAQESFDKSIKEV